MRSEKKTGTRENPIRIVENVEAGEGGNSPARPVKRRRNVQGEEREGAEGYTATMRSETPGTPKRGSFSSSEAAGKGMGKKEGETKLRLTMWCFLGKLAERKSLKPDLFRRAVGKAQGSPRTSRRLSRIKSSAKSVRIEVEPIENRDSTEERGESPSRSAFEIIGEDSSRSAFESEVREGVLQSRDGPAEGDVKEALGNVPADDFGEDGDWEDLNKDEDSVPVDAAIRDESKEQTSEADEDTEQKPANINTDENDEKKQENNTFDIHQDAMMIQPSADEASFLQKVSVDEDIIDKDAAEEDALAHEDLQAEPSSPAQETTDTRAARTTEVLSNLTVLPVLDDTSGRKEDDQLSASPQEEAPNLGIQMLPDFAAESRIVEPGMAAPEKKRDQEMCLYDQVSTAETVTNNTAPVIHEKLDFHNTTNEEPGSDPPTQDYSPVAVQSSEQCEIEESAHLVAPLRDDSATLLVDSVPGLHLDELSASPLKQSPRPVVKLPSCTAASNQDGQQQAGMEHLTDSQDAPGELPTRMTRSGARFSDDTNLLKDFLNRAQARKLAKDGKIPAQGPTGTSPRRSPRKALAEKDSNSPSPHKSKDLATRPGTPPGKERLDAFSFDDIDELNAEPTSCRRSNRTRLPTVSRASPGAPSFIPVRRADGTDPVVLQKSMAQDLAVQTRANTRRNKGQSKPPKLALQTLTAESTEGTANRVRARAKQVSWGENLVYYQAMIEAAAGEEGKEEKRPKVRRLRGLGATNGTPAPKREVDNSLPQGTSTPAPRRRGKIS